ncbi:MAG TPA: [FeFe] hydrogenase H-cluster maturation GTPase HydF [bacterium]|nr:[FeFe] hydrogenase H-cluster maturation GTPase HydF [bacterium]HOL47556.1 [FeFe] hydrogenase H-cluster maturation GTPase HydF [bacterium]HPQ18449.1 [FeFe] hydrogenase H-cluster maturation GTPase HydF [bacterium]
MFRTPVSNRLHIGFFGKRNTGKSSLINAITNQEIAIVSDIPGTTTDPVYKSMEILPIGPVVLIDTAGIDDEGVLGEERIKKTLKVLRKVDISLIIVEPDTQINEYEEELIKLFNEKKIPYIFVLNKCEIKGNLAREYFNKKKIEYLEISAKEKIGIEKLKNEIIKIAPIAWSPLPLVADLINEKDIVILVCPIDSAMPQGRLILPQVQVLRDILDTNAIAYVVKETELQDCLNLLKTKPKLIITDSQVFEYVKKIIPEDYLLTSFSIVFARHKGDLLTLINGVFTIDKLNDGDEVLIAEACTHHIQPEDIGRVKIPNWLNNYTGKKIKYTFVSGGDFPDDIGKYKLIIICGGCMVNRKEIMFRIEKAKSNNIPITNYGVLIAYLNGILERAIKPFKFQINNIMF